MEDRHAEERVLDGLERLRCREGGEADDVGVGSRLGVSDQTDDDVTLPRGLSMAREWLSDRSGRMSHDVERQTDDVQRVMV